MKRTVRRSRRTAEQAVAVTLNRCCKELVRTKINFSLAEIVMGIGVIRTLLRDIRGADAFVAPFAGTTSPTG